MLAQLYKCISSEKSVFRLTFTELPVHKNDLDPVSITDLKCVCIISVPLFKMLSELFNKRMALLLLVGKSELSSQYNVLR